jgi:hypothetical protein
MKKKTLLFIIIGILSVPFLFSQTPALAWNPHRIAEFGFDVSAGFANSLLRLSDIFNVRKTITLNFNKISVRDMMFQAGGKGSVFFNFNVKSLSFGLFGGFEVDGFAGASEDLIRLIKEGNGRGGTFDGTLMAGASVFVDAGIRASFPVKRLRLTVKPAVFAPLLYVPPPDISWRMDTSGGSTTVVLDAIKMDMYSVLDLNDTRDGSTSMTIPLGADLSVEAVYPLFAKLDVGLGIEHIPLAPASLRYRARMESSTAIYKLDDIFGIDLGGGGSLNAPALPAFTTTYSSGESRLVFRPLRFDFFAEYRPRGEDLFVIRPVIGFSVLTIYGYNKACFNAGVEGQLNILRGFSLSLSTAYRERVWRQSLGFMANFRVFELIAGVSFQGTNFTSSFAGRGLGVSLGMRFGY